MMTSIPIVPIADSTSTMKIVVLGSSNHTDVDAVDWSSSAFPNLVDYDVCIVNIRSLSDTVVSSIKNEQFEKLQKALTRLLLSDGKIIVLTDFVRSVKKPNSYPDRNDNYDWSPINFNLHNETGDTLNIKKNAFPKYFSRIKSWNYFITSCTLTTVLASFFGNKHTDMFTFPCEPLIQNREGRIISGRYVCELYRQKSKSDGFHSHKYYEEKPDKKFGEISLLPLIPELDDRDAVNLVLEDILGRPQTSLPPSWVSDFAIPRAIPLYNKLDGLKANIAGLRDSAAHLQKQIDEVEEYKKIIYTSGAELENIFKRCLEDMGSTVLPARHGNEEYILRYRDHDHLVEVKGVSKSASLTHVRQLIDHILIYQEEEKVESHGILFVNAWKSTPPKERNSTDKPDFPPDVIKRANEINIALVSSLSFLHAFFRFMDDKKLGTAILDRITTGRGIIDFSNM